MLKAKDVLDIVLPKLKKSFETTLTRKDPRLGVTIGKTLIIEKGKKII
jgi:hypothetical protein